VSSASHLNVKKFAMIRSINVSLYPKAVLFWAVSTGSFPSGLSVGGQTAKSTKKGCTVMDNMNLAVLFDGIRCLIQVGRSTP